MKNFLTIGGGIATIVSMFLPMMTVLGVEANGMAMGGVAYFWIACGAIIAVVGFVGKKMLNILSLLLGLAVAGLAFKYQNDAKMFGEVGIGLWVMLGGGVLAVIGSIMGLVRKTA